jgi:hypothetical protein
VRAGTRQQSTPLILQSIPEKLHFIELPEIDSLARVMVRGSTIPGEDANEFGKIGGPAIRFSGCRWRSGR